MCVFQLAVSSRAGIDVGKVVIVGVGRAWGTGEDLIEVRPEKKSGDGD